MANEYEYSYDVTPEEKAALDFASDALDLEEKNWMREGISPNMVIPDQYFMSAQIWAMWELLREKLDMTMPETELYFKEKLLAKMRDDRKTLLTMKREAMQRARQAELLVPPAKKLIGLDGQELNGSGN